MPASMIPTPKRFSSTEGKVVLDPTWGLNNLGADRNVLERFSIKLSLAPRSKSKNITLRKTNMSHGEDAYDLEIKPNSIIVSAQTERGFLFALQTLLLLKTGQDLPACMINDWPSLAIRGIQLDLGVMREMDVEAVISILQACARFKLNRVVMDYGDRFPYSQLETEVPGMFTPDEIQRLVRVGGDLGLEIVPFVPTLGGLGFVLRQRKYADLREPPGPDGRIEQICPSKSESLALVKAMGEEICKAHRSRLIHLGGCDTHQLGICDECARRAKEGGVGKLFADYMNSVASALARRGRSAIVYDDILCRFPEALEDLNKNVLVMYRDYWTTKAEGPLVVAPYSREGMAPIVYDSRWREQWAADLGDLENRVLKSFADVHGEPKHLEESLGRDFLVKFRKYLGPNYPKYVTGFPYIAFYKDNGFRVIGSPGLLADATVDLRHNLPHFERFFHNIKSFAGRIKEEEQLGIISAATNDWPPETMLHGIIATAQFGWR